MKPGVTYRDGIAIVSDPARTTEVNVSLTAYLVCQGDDVEVNKADVLALSAGYQALEAESEALRAELAAARAGTIGKEYAEAMQGARKVLADVFRTGEQFLEVYDSGDAPNDQTDRAMRAALNEAGNWLVSDSTEAVARCKLLKGGAA